MQDFESRGVRVVAVSSDAVDVNRAHRGKIGITVPILSDEKGEVMRRYDVLHTSGGPGGQDIARPAEFLVDSSGTVVWRNLTESAAVRTRPGEVLKAFDSVPH